MAIMIDYYVCSLHNMFKYTIKEDENNIVQ
jgi:hypothetical protein